MLCHVIITGHVRQWCGNNSVFFPLSSSPIAAPPTPFPQPQSPLPLLPGNWKNSIQKTTVGTTSRLNRAFKTKNFSQNSSLIGKIGYNRVFKTKISSTNFTHLFPSSPNKLQPKLEILRAAAAHISSVGVNCNCKKPYNSKPIFQYVINFTGAQSEQGVKDIF